MFARHFIDSLDFARQGGELQGEVPVAKLPRLQDILAGPEGDIRYLVRGLLDKSGKPALEIKLDGECVLRCQRCLEGYAYPLHLSSRLFLVREERPLDESSLVEEGPDSIVADEHLNVLELLEDEILLSLPFAPKHPAGNCHHKTEDDAGSSRNPFAILSGLKRQ